MLTFPYSGKNLIGRTCARLNAASWPLELSFELWREFGTIKLTLRMNFV